MLNVRPDRLTYNQFYLGIEMLGEAQRRGLRDRAIAARIAMADKRGWTQFINRLDKKHMQTTEGPSIEDILRGGPPRGPDESGIEWQKLD